MPGGARQVEHYFRRGRTCLVEHYFKRGVLLSQWQAFVSPLPSADRARQQVSLLEHSLRASESLSLSVIAQLATRRPDCTLKLRPLCRCYSVLTQEQQLEAKAEKRRQQEEFLRSTALLSDPSQIACTFAVHVPWYTPALLPQDQLAQ
eukprot:scaffold49585_cov22-Tisochrysis_lutea.AAC.1